MGDVEVNMTMQRILLLPHQLPLTQDVNLQSSMTVGLCCSDVDCTSVYVEKSVTLGTALNSLAHLGHLCPQYGRREPCAAGFFHSRFLPVAAHPPRLPALQQGYRLLRRLDSPDSSFTGHKRHLNRTAAPPACPASSSAAIASWSASVIT